MTYHRHLRPASGPDDPPKRWEMDLAARERFTQDIEELPEERDELDRLVAEIRARQKEGTT